MHDRKIISARLLNGEQQSNCAWEYLIIPLLAFPQKYAAVLVQFSSWQRAHSHSHQDVSHFGPHPKRFLPTTSILEEQNHTSAL
jgi:hypothetical protein